MTPFRILAAVALCLSLGACATVDTASRNAIRPDAPPAGAVPQAAPEVVLTPQYDVTAVNISVPGTLRVSEANVFYPIADIVWRGEPRGDRYAQVKAIFEDGFRAGTAAMTKGPEVVVDVAVLRFHILTEKAKIFTGGVFGMRFSMTVRDARTGTVIDGPRIVSADMPGTGGRKALEEEARGLTQRVKIVAHLAEVAKRELSVPVELPQKTTPDRVTSRRDTPLARAPAL